MAPKRTHRPKGNVRVAARLKRRRRRMTIDILPEDVLLEIFELYVDPTRKYDGLEAWCTLAHVCRKWRNLVLESPLRLNLRIHCNPTTPVREKLDIWPALPIVLAQYSKNWPENEGVVNVAGAFEQNDRLCQISLWFVPILQMEEILAAMHKPFPVLTHLDLGTGSYGTRPGTPVDPDLFLGGSAPCLQFLHLDHIPFPGLPKLLLSATHLTDLRLSHSGYILPEAMVSCFSALTRLETFILELNSTESEHRPPPPPPPPRTLLPALTRFQFSGASEYLEDLVVRFDALLLDNVKIYLLHQSIPDTAQLAQFINRTPKLKALNEAHVVFYGCRVHLTLRRVFEKWPGISPEVVDLRVSSVAQVCALSLSLSQAFSATVERLYICDNYDGCDKEIKVEKNHWLELLRPFTSVKSVYLSQDNVRRITPTLQELVGERMAGVLPALQTLFLENLNQTRPLPEHIGSFVSRRQFSGYPVAVSQWNKGQPEVEL